jgi:hypothetical protein
VTGLNSVASWLLESERQGKKEKPACTVMQITVTDENQQTTTTQQTQILAAEQSADTLV